MRKTPFCLSFHQGGVLCAAGSFFFSRVIVHLFLKKVNTLPPVPGRMLLTSLSFFALLMVLMYMHDNYEIKHQWYIIVMEFICTVSVIAALQVNYNGIILLFVAHIMKYFEGSSQRLLPLILGSTFFLIFDFNACSNIIKIISFETYTEYYIGTVAAVLILVKNLSTCAVGK